MTRAIYEIKLKESYFPASSGAEALEMMNNGNVSSGLTEDDVVMRIVATSDHTIKLFLLCKTMYDMEKYSFKEVYSAVRALAVEMGYFAEAVQIADLVTTWTERISEDMTLTEFQEWLIG